MAHQGPHRLPLALFVTLRSVRRLPSFHKLKSRQTGSGGVRSLSVCCRLQADDVELTSVRYPHLKRGDYTEVSTADVSFFKEILNEPGMVLDEVDDVAPYNMDWLKTVRGVGKVVLRPKTTAQVSQILRHCNERRLAVVPQGGNTGLVGGSVPVFDEVVLSTQLMNNVISLDPVSGVLVCQAGCVLEKLDNLLAEESLMMPLDLGAKGSCQIGGNVSTNAGGIRLLRYGSLHGSVLGIEAVLADGQVVNTLSTLRKDNTGYDLKQLFIGSEGTLGIVTAVSILCPRRPNSVNVAFLSCESFAKVLQTFTAARSHLGEILSAYELLDSQSAEVAKQNLNLSNPLSGQSPFYVLIETSGSHSDHDQEKLSGFLEEVLGQGLVSDGLLATEPSKIKYIWSIRERLAEALLHDGYCYKYDVSLPLPCYYDLVHEMRQRLAGVATRVIGYGHLGDGNLHLNATSPAYSKEMANLLEPYLYEWVGKHNGSISAEHGLGLVKRAYINFSKPPAAVDLMRQMKRIFDPHAILNPYKTVTA